MHNDFEILVIATPLKVGRSKGLSLKFARIADSELDKYRFVLDR